MMKSFQELFYLYSNRRKRHANNKILTFLKYLMLLDLD